MEDKIFKDCMYFTATRLYRAISRMAEEAFVSTGLSPTYAFLMMMVYKDPGISQRDLAEQLHITPSTLTRLIDKLENKALVERQIHSKKTNVKLTPEGTDMNQTIMECWNKLYERYCEILGENEAKFLTEQLYATSLKLEQ